MGGMGSRLCTSGMLDQGMSGHGVASVIPQSSYIYGAIVWARGQGSLSSNVHRDKFWGFGSLPSLRGQRGGCGGKEVG